MTATLTRSAAQANLARWQSRLVTAQAAYRKRQAEAQQLYPGSEQQRQQYCQQQRRDSERYAAFVAQAQAYVAAALASDEATSRLAPAQLSWWARIRQRWAGWLGLGLLAFAAPAIAQQAPASPQLHVWPQPLHVFTAAYLPFTGLGPASGSWHVRITPAGPGPAVLDRRLPAATPGLNISLLAYAPGTYLIDVSQAGRHWTTRMDVRAY